MTNQHKLDAARDPNSEPLHSYDVFPVYQNPSWELDDIPWDEFRADLVRPEDIAFAKGAAMGESNSIAAQHGFFKVFDQFGRVDDGTEWERVRTQLFSTLSEITGRPIVGPRDIRAALADAQPAET